MRRFDFWMNEKGLSDEEATTLVQSFLWASQKPGVGDFVVALLQRDMGGLVIRNKLFGRRIIARWLQILVDDRTDTSYFAILEALLHSHYDFQHLLNLYPALRNSEVGQKVYVLLVDAKVENDLAALKASRRLHALTADRERLQLIHEQIQTLYNNFAERHTTDKAGLSTLHRDVESALGALENAQAILLQEDLSGRPYDKTTEDALVTANELSVTLIDRLRNNLKDSDDLLAQFLLRKWLMDVMSTYLEFVKLANVPQSIKLQHSIRKQLDTIGNIHAFIQEDQFQKAKSDGTVPSSMALAGRQGKNKLDGDISGKGVSATSPKLKTIFADIDGAEAARLQQEAQRQKIQFYVVDDADGAFIKRIGNKILVNTARTDLSEATRLTALIHDIEGHDWAFVQEALGRPYAAEDVDIYEAYAMAVAEFRKIPNRARRLQAVLGAFKALSILEISGQADASVSVGNILKSSGLPAERVAIVRNSVNALLNTKFGREPVSTALADDEFSSDAPLARLEEHLRQLADLEEVPTFASGWMYWTTVLPASDFALPSSQYSSNPGWWMRLGTTWAGDAAERANNQKEFAAQIDRVLAALKLIKTRPGQLDAAAAADLAQRILAARLRMIVLDQDLDDVYSSLDDFAAHYPTLKKPMQSLVERIKPYIEAQQGSSSVIVSGNRKLFSEMALQAIGAEETYDQAARRQLKQYAQSMVERNVLTKRQSTARVSGKTS